MTLIFKQTTEVAGQITCSLSTSVLLSPPLQNLKSTLTSTPTSPLSFFFSVPGARGKNNKILTLFSLLVYSNHERHIDASKPTERYRRTNDTARPWRKANFPRFLRRQNACLYSEQSAPFQSPQTRNPDQKYGDTERKERRAIQLQKLLGGRRCFDEMLRANQGIVR